MGAFISQQPNGKYCRFSTVVDTVTHYNMTVQDYIDLKVAEARQEAIDTIRGHCKPFSDVLENFNTTNETVDEFNEKLIKMGAEPIKF